MFHPESAHYLIKKDRNDASEFKHYVTFSQSPSSVTISKSISQSMFTSVNISVIHHSSHKYSLTSQEAHVSIIFYRGIKSNASYESQTEQVKIEFESMKSLISDQRANGRTQLDLKDFRKRENFIESYSKFIV